MNDEATINENVLNFLKEDLPYKPHQMKAALELLVGGATLPFVARYRKEATGALNEVELKEIQEKYTYYEELESRKETVLSTIEKQGKLTDDLKAEIVACRDKTTLEDLYAPYKPKRRTRAQKAREKGLEPLADLIHIQPDNAKPLEILAEDFLTEEVETIEAALQGAHDILAERVSDDPAIRQWVRDYMYNNGMLVANARKEWKERQSKFEMYYDYQEPVKSILGHRFLAIRRGANEDVLNYTIELDPEPIYDFISQKYIKDDSPYEKFLEDVVEDAYQRLLSLSIASGILADLREEAETEAIKVFAMNVRDKLMAPVAGHRSILAIDPGFRTGCKVVVIDATGKFLINDTIYPHPPQEKVGESEKILQKLMEDFDVELVAIGNGTAGRETYNHVEEVINKYHFDATPVMVNESGASVYSASEAAVEEFPELDLTVRGAISIGRRLQDPLAELVKIDPKSIGVGQYQHDVNQNKLKDELDTVVSSCVNAVGVDINTASRQLLSYVSGLSDANAKSIIKRRDSQGPFTNRKELLDVSGIGPATYEQAAGFLKIPNGNNPLDNSNVHPESYYIVEKMVKAVGKKLDDVIGRGLSVDPKNFVDEQKGLPTIKDILEELKRPGRDPRDEFQMANFREDINEISDLREGMILEGTVTNVTHFGAFVDIGVHQDGLVHISEIANKFVKDPHEEVKVEEVVKVKVLDVDEDRKRISLSIKQVG